MLKDFLLEVVLPMILIIGTILMIFFPIGYYWSCQQARVFNLQNDTNYSCWDFFWASEQINIQTQTIKLLK